MFQKPTTVLTRHVVVYPPMYPARNIRYTRVNCSLLLVTPGTSTRCFLSCTLSSSMYQITKLIATVLFLYLFVCDFHACLSLIWPIYKYIYERIPFTLCVFHSSLCHSFCSVFVLSLKNAFPSSSLPYIFYSNAPFAIGKNLFGIFFLCVVSLQNSIQKKNAPFSFTCRVCDKTIYSAVVVQSTR